MGNPAFTHKQFAAMSAKRAAAKPGEMPAKKTPQLNTDGTHDYLQGVDLQKGHTPPTPGMLKNARAMRKLP